MPHSGHGGGPASAPSSLHSTRPVSIQTLSPASQAVVEPTASRTTSVAPPLPPGLRLSEGETQSRPSNPLNLRLMASPALRGSRAARSWSVRPQEPVAAFPPNSLVVLGRSSQLLTPQKQNGYETA
ncbi:hypothetical protein R1flu_027392 [Riccia fluitans]|uniref:Uncharacterized protein n=1 Tax=Riccia fluitans TaxID=41844 RepID=A0ABD1XJ79_9MARC